MSCRVNRSEQGLIKEVVLENRQPSKLFNKINSNIFIPNSEVALNIYSNAYTKEFESQEPDLVYRDNKGILHNSVETLLINDGDGVVELGFQKEGNYTPIATFNTQAGTYSRFLASQVKQGLLSVDKVFNENGEAFLSGKGTLDRTKSITAQLFREQALDELTSRVTVGRDGTIKIDNESDFITVNLKNGETETVAKSDIPNLLKRDDVLNKPELILFSEDVLLRSFKKGVARPVDKSKLHILNLKSFLTSLGFSATSLEAYSKSFNNRHGKDPDVSALIDLANRVVAISEGGNQMDLMSEEVAHLAVETYNDQASILGAITNIHLTPEYNEWAEFYREKYSKQYEGLELEEAVRKEILGKVIARAIKNNSQISEEALTIWQRIKEYLASIFKPAHRRNLDRLSEQISKDILSNNLSAFSLENLKGEGVFYSAGNERTTKAINGAIKILEDLSKKVKGTDRVTIASRIKQIDEMASRISELEHMQQIQKTVRANLKIIESKLNSENPDATIDSFDIETFTTLETKLRPELGELMNYIDRNKAVMTPSEKAVAEELRKELQAIDSDITRMSSKVQDKSTERFETDFRRDLEESHPNLSEKEKQKVLDMATGVQKETSSLSSKFGIMSYSSNILKGYLGDIVQRMYARVQLQAQAYLNPIIDKIYKAGLQKYQKSIYRKDEDGNQTYYFKSGIKIHEHEKNTEDEKVRIIKTLMPDAEEEVIRQAVKTENISALLESTKMNDEYYKALYAWKLENDEKVMPKEYYEQKEQMQKDANVSDDSIYEIEGLKGQIQEIFSQAKDPKTGKVDKSKLSSEQLISVKELQRNLKTKRSVIDQRGEVYEGLRVAKWEELTQAEKDSLPFIGKYGVEFQQFLKETKGSFTVLEEGTNLEDLSPNGRLALDMFNLSTVMRLKALREGRTFEKEASNDFVAQIEQLESEGRFEDAYEFVMSNSTITFTDSYYDSLDTGEPMYIDDAQAEIDNLPDGARKETKQQALEVLKSLMVRKREIIKQYRKFGDSTEIAMDDMTGTVRGAIIDIEAQIAEQRRILNVKNITERTSTPISKRVVSDTFKAEQKERGLAVFEFAKEHMTKDNILELDNFDKYLRDNLIRGFDTEIVQRYEDFIREQRTLGVISVGDDVNTTYNNLRDAFATSKLASYAYSYKIEEFTNLLQQAKRGDVNLSEFFRNPDKHPILEYAKLNVDFDWAESTNKTNEFFFSSFGKSIPNFEKYKDAEVLNHYGISDEAYIKAGGDLTQITANSNVEEFEMLKEAIAINKEINKITGDNTNIYLRPQVSKTYYEKVKSNVTTLSPKKLGTEIKDSIFDSFSYRADEKDFGETDANGVPLNASGVKVPPRMFRNKIEDANLLTEDTISASSLALEQAYLYRGRIDNIDKVNTIIRHAKKAQFEDGGLFKGKITKEGEVSNVVKDLQEYADDHLYGIKQTRQLTFNVGSRTVDLTKTIRTIQRLSSSLNLKYNPFISATSLATGMYNNFQNAIVGDDIHSSSYKLGLSALSTDIAKYLPDSTKVNRDSRLNTRMEGFGLVDVSTKLRGTIDSDVERSMSRMGHMMDRVANLPVVPRVLYAILKDIRFSDGSFVNYNQFATIQKNKNENISKKEIENAWKTLEKETFDTFIDDTTNVLKPNQKFLDKGFDEKAFQNYVINISTKAKQLIQSVDGQLNEGDRVMAQRDVFLNTLMQHKGWLPINMYKMFRKNHFNFAQGKFEEGHYKTALVIAGEMLKRFKNPASIVEYYKDLDSGQKKNLKRVMVHSMMMLATVVLVLALAGADDDDDTFLEDFVRYVSYRTYAENRSITPMGIYDALMDTGKQPFVALSSYEKWTEIPMSIFSEEEGAFVSSLTKGTPVKRLDQLQDLDATLSTWKKFNDNNLALINFFEGN